MKVLCLGDNSSAEALADKQTLELAKKNNSLYKGQISSLSFEILNGYYHTGPAILNLKDIKTLAKKFNKIIFLDQEINKYTHYSLFLDVYELLNVFKDLETEVEVLNENNFKILDYWYSILQKNKSFCVHPWTTYRTDNGKATLCPHSSLTKITDSTNLKKNWLTNKEYNNIRNKFLTGEKFDGCKNCYLTEDSNIKSKRWQDSLEWILRLNLKNLNDLKNLETPTNYEIIPDNNCNLRCRMCGAHGSSLIEKENTQIQDKKFFKLTTNDPPKFKEGFDAVNLESVKRFVVGGGDPTANPNFYAFIEKCLEKNKTNFELHIGSNCVSISDSAFNTFKKFPNIKICASIDGIPKVNEYIRWGTNAKQQIENINHFLNDKHDLHFLSIVQIYNVHCLGETMEFFDKNFPGIQTQFNFVKFNLYNDEGNILDPFNHPDKTLVLNSLQKAIKTQCYIKNTRGAKQIVDKLYDYYSNNPTFDKTKLENFFYYNDMLDKHRGSKLADYIPELESCRKYIK